MSTSENLHTPTPWRVQPSVMGNGIIIQQDNGPVDPPTYIAHIMLPIGHKVSAPKDAANAALIVTAVNAHDALVAALEDALKLLDQADFKNGNTDSTGSIDEGEVLANRWISEIRAALTLAKGTP